MFQCCGTKEAVWKINCVDGLGTAAAAAVAPAAAIDKYNE